MPKKRRTVGGFPAHTSATRQRTTNRDHACLVRFHGEVSSPWKRIRKRQQRPMMKDEVVAAQLEQLL